MCLDHILNSIVFCNVARIMSHFKLLTFLSLLPLIHSLVLFHRKTSCKRHLSQNLQSKRVDAVSSTKIIEIVDRTKQAVGLVMTIFLHSSGLCGHCLEMVLCKFWAIFWLLYLSIFILFFILLLLLFNISFNFLVVFFFFLFWISSSLCLVPVAVVVVTVIALVFFSLLLLLLLLLLFLFLHFLLLSSVFIHFVVAVVLLSLLL